MAAMTPSDQARPGIPDPGEDYREALIERVARRVEAAGMSAPAIAFLESSRPLAFLGSQMLLVAQPMLSPFLSFLSSSSSSSLDVWIEILEDRGSVERLERRLEQGPRANLNPE
jgi:hypothetical protein